MLSVRGSVTAVAVLLLAGCASFPHGTYFPPPTDSATVRMANTLHRAALAAGDDPGSYSFAFVRSRAAAAYSDEDATFYFTDGLMRLDQAVIDAVVAHEVAHEVLGHVGARRKLSLSLSAGFGAVGILAPGVGLLDFVVNPLVVRAYGRRQELEADQKAVEILRAMGHAAPRRALAQALQVLDAHVPKEKEEPDGLLASHPTLEERLAALDPLEPEPVAGVIPAKK
jgi:Zn-dependent protease with chaperone function